MATKFADFIASNKIDPRRLVVASRQLERLRPEDRAIKLAKRQSKGADAPAAAQGDEGDGDKKAAPTKRRSGRVVTRPLVDKATAGKPVSGAAKRRLLRAVNRILEQRKSDAVDLGALF